MWANYPATVTDAFQEAGKSSLETFENQDDNFETFWNLKKVTNFAVSLHLTKV